MSRICNNCNTVNEDTGRFCVQCGAELPDENGVLCPQCGAEISPTDERCPKCGAVNGNYQRAKDAVPKTIMELQQWYAARNLPPEETTRFFIGKNYKGAKAFGIYKDSNGDIVVYKNKADGSRAVRYRGRDEAFAVNEIYTKLRETIQTQKSRPGYGSGRSTFSSSGSNNSGKKNGCLSKPLLAFLVVVLICILLDALIVKGCNAGCNAASCTVFSCETTSCDGTRRGYYSYGNDIYYYEHGTWFLYNALANSWSRSYSEPSGYESYNYSSFTPYRVSDATESSAYEDASSSWSSSSGWSSSSSWGDFWSSDSDYDWDSGSSWDFDFGGSWDSDW